MFRTNPIEITPESEEYKQLTDRMKQDCQGKVIYQVDVEVMNETEVHQKSGRKTLSGSVKIKSLDEVPELEKLLSLQRQEDFVACPFDKLMVACQTLIVDPGRTCYYWDWNGIKLKHFTSLKGENLCTRCCKATETSVIPCDCMKQSAVAFSTGYKDLFGSGDLGCPSWSHFCNYDPENSKIKDELGCPYLPTGICSSQGSKTCNRCQHGECRSLKYGEDDVYANYVDTSNF